MTKYRIKPYDVVNNIWIIEKKVFLFFWMGIGAGSEEKCKASKKKLEEANKQ